MGQTNSYGFLYFEIFNGLLPGGNFRAAGVWFLVVAAITTIGLVKTRFGNHILASGGDRNVATALGVRVFRTKPRHWENNYSKSRKRCPGS